MSELKLQIREYTYSDEQCPLISALKMLEMVGFLDHKASVRCKDQDSAQYKERMKRHIAENFRNKLYGQIIRAIDEVEQKTRADCFNYSFSAEERIRTAFQELRNSIPEITYN